MSAPSGRQLPLQAGAARAVVVEVGGGLRTLTLGDQDVVAGYAEDEMPVGGRGQQLLPWPNRTGDGSWSWRGRSLQLPLNEPAKRNANHGLTRWLAWEVVEASTSTVVVRHVLQPSPGYPFRVDVSTAWSLTETSLTAEVTATADGEAAPFGYGCHPYLAGRVDDMVVRVPADVRLTVDDRGLPTGTADVAHTPFDLRQPRRVGDLVLDTCFRATEVEVRTGDRTTTVWGEGDVRWFQLYSGETLPEPQRRQSLAVEPMTCPPDALRTGTDLVVLEPGRPWRTAWGIRFG